MFAPSHLILYSARISDTGTHRDKNEDSIASYDLNQNLICSEKTHQGKCYPFGQVHLVADGMGGCNAGEIASEFATNYHLNALQQNKEQCDDPTQIHNILELFMHDCHKKLTDMSNENPEMQGMGTTLTLGLFLENACHMIHIGDSRLYRMRDKQLTQMSNDHSYLGDLVRRGMISQEDARNHPKRNLIDQALGGDLPNIDPQIKSFSIEKGDAYLLCTDGLSDSIPMYLIESEMKSCKHNNLSEISRRLVDLANDLDGSDNISAVLIYIGEEVC